MKFIRKFLRILKYRIKFLAKNNNAKINYFVQSRFLDKSLTDLMNYYGSDKGGLNKDHNFSDYYSTIFYDKKLSVKNLLEIGLGTNNTKIPSNMGLQGKPLASLYAWKDYFPNANIYGADILYETLFTDHRIQTFYCDQLDKKSIEKLWSNFNSVLFDVILEDGLHTYEANIHFFENSFHKLRNEGFYIIEDVLVSEIPKYESYFKSCSIKFEKHQIVDLYNPGNKMDNVLIIIKK